MPKLIKQTPFSGISTTDRRAHWISLCEKQIINGTATPEVEREYFDYAPLYYVENSTQIAMKTRLEDMPKLARKLALLSQHKLARY